VGNSLALEVENFFVEIFRGWLNGTRLNSLTSDARKSKYEVSALARSSPGIKFAIVKTCIF
jgi:hypothetical protein